MLDAFVMIAAAILWIVGFVYSTAADEQEWAEYIATMLAEREGA
jgi:steroid 5-alpha reductase family enzyme